MARPREFDESQVVRAAMQAFWENGYKGTSVQDLVRATGLERGSLYGAFGDKSGLFLASLDLYMASTLEWVRQLIREHSDPVEGLRAFVRQGGRNCANDRAVRGCMVGNTSCELAAHDEVSRLRVQRFVGEMQILMADALREGKRLGTFDPSRDADAVATFIQCSLQGLTLLAKSGPGPDVIDGVVDQILRNLN